MLKEIRAFLRRIGANALILPHNDSYFNDQLRPEDERLAYVTGFTGSAGVAIITPRQAVLFVDGRYTEQAKKQTKFKVLQVPRQATVSDWLMRFLRPNYIVAYDPWQVSVAQLDKWAELFTKRGARLMPTASNPIDKFWLTRPVPTPIKVYDYPVQFSGKTTTQKLALRRRFFKQNDIDAFVLTNADTVSWLLNKRSDAVMFNPVYLDRLLIYPKGKPVSFNEKTLTDLKGKVVGIDVYETPVKIKQMLIEAGASLHYVRNPFALAQSIKNNIEVTGMQTAAILDSIAVCRHLAWLQGQVKDHNEYDICAHLEQLRRQNPAYVCNSFADISAVGKNAALPHYQASSTVHTKLSKAPIYLLDTGGQYLYGTTDMTRTVATGEVSALMKRRYTQVLKGHIALAQASFPAGISGANLDVLARQFLWAEGLDFDHGTGHGIGCFLNVHEAPPSISPYAREALQENMIISNEPGFYAAGKFGIRIENMMRVVRDKSKKGRFLKFETLTFVPFCDELIERELLTQEEQEWIAAYYIQILRAVYSKVERETQLWLTQQMKRWIKVEKVISTC